MWHAAFSPLTISLAAFMVIMAGVGVGALLRRALPGHHLSDGAKDVVRLGTGLLGTIAALVLGLLIASAKTSYDNQASQVRHMVASLIMLDRVLAEYGPDAKDTRSLLRTGIGTLVDRIWQESSARAGNPAPFEPAVAGEAIFSAIQRLAPGNDAQTSLKTRAMQAGVDLAQARLLLFAQSENAIPMPFLAVLVLWLTIIFASFSLFSPLNATLIVALSIFALSASAAIFLILELNHPFGGLMHLPSAPLRNALGPLNP
jgi:hypothetical protein